MNRFEQKVADRLGAAGISADDLAGAATAYMDDAGGKCVLCDYNPLKYRYLLTFPKTPSVEFFPVGSNCIKTWVKALPDSEGRTAALANISAAEKEMKRQRKLIEKLHGADDDDGARLMRVFFRLPKDLQDGDGPLADIGAKVLKFGSFASDKQRNFFGGIVRRAARAAGIDDRAAPGSGRHAAQTSAEAPAESAPAPAESPDCPVLAKFDALDAEWVAQRGGALADIGRKAKEAGSAAFLSEKQCSYLESLIEGAGLLQRYQALPPGAAVVAGSALLDMGGSLAQFGSFRSAKQRGYFTSLLEKAEALPPPPPPAPGFAPEASEASEAEDEDWEDEPF